jgi:hypothetical protein
VKGAEPGPAPAPQARADVAPGEAAQEGAQGGGGLDAEAQDPAGSAGAEGLGVVDAVATCERGHQERQELVPHVRPAGGPAEVEEPLDQLLQAQVESQRGRQQEPRIGHELRPVERRVDPVNAVGRSHPAGAPWFGFDGCVATPSFPFGRAPVLLSRIVNHAGASVDPG